MAQITAVHCFFPANESTPMTSVQLAERRQAKKQVSRHQRTGNLQQDEASRQSSVEIDKVSLLEQQMKECQCKSYTLLCDFGYLFSSVITLA